MDSATILREDEQLQSWLISVLVSMTILWIVAFVLRFVSRRLAHQKLWWDDWLISASMVRGAPPPGSNSL